MTTYPDVVALLRAYLTPIVAPVPVTSRVPDPRPDRLVQLRRVGGPRGWPVLDQPRVDVHAWALTEPSGFGLAMTVRDAIHALRGTTLLGPAVYQVEEFLGPRQLDDPLTGTPRWWATYSLTVRAE